MGERYVLLLATAAAAVLCCSAAGAHGAMGGARAGTFVHQGVALSRPVARGFAHLHLGRPSHPFAFRAFPLSTVTVAGDDDMDDYDTGGFDEDDLADMHFRAQESFGPWDLPMRPVISGAAPSGPWGPQRMDFRQGYGPQDGR